MMQRPKLQDAGTTGIIGTMEITGTTGMSGTIGKIRKLCGNSEEQTAIAIRKQLIYSISFFPLKTQRLLKGLCLSLRAWAVR